MTEARPSLGEPEIAALARRIDRPVVLVGLMGVGKTTVGKRLAGLLNRDFLDADTEIERAADRSVAEIFAAHGEPYFRDGERRVIARIMEQGCGVLATGGGAFVNAETRALILEKGIAVWLDSDIETLVDRTARRDHRPLLNSGNPREILTRLKAERDPLYAQAPVHVFTDQAPHQTTALNILEAIDAWL